MKTNRIVITALLAASTFVAGCAAPGYPQASSPYPSSYPASGSQQGAYSSYGVVDSIQAVNTQSGPGGIGAGTVIGGLVGGLLGNQVGGGTGRGLATAAGAIGGAVVGNQVEKRTNQGEAAYQIGVRLDNGSYQTYTQESIGDLNIGNRVRVDNGRVYRY